MHILRSVIGLIEGVWWGGDRSKGATMISIIFREVSSSMYQSPSGKGYGSAVVQDVEVRASYGSEVLVWLASDSHIKSAISTACLHGRTMWRPEVQNLLAPCAEFRLYGMSCGNKLLLNVQVSPSMKTMSTLLALFYTVILQVCSSKVVEFTSANIVLETLFCTCPITIFSMTVMEAYTYSQLTMLEPENYVVLN